MYIVRYFQNLSIHIIRDGKITTNALCIFKESVLLEHITENVLPQKEINSCNVLLGISGVVFSSPELKAQVSFSDHLSSVVCLSVRLCNFSHFHLLLKNHWANFNQTWHKVSLYEGVQVCSNEGPRPFQRGDNWEKIKIN